MNSFWDAPSCINFLHEISNKLMNGLIALLYLPAHAPKNIKAALKPVIGNGQAIRYENIKLDECKSDGYKPVESFLCNHFELDINTETYVDKTPASIFEKIPSDIHRVIVFEKITPEILPHFKAFLIDLSRYNLSKPIYQRHKFVVILDPLIIKENDLPAEAGLSKLYFRNISSSFDLTYILRYQLKFNQCQTRILEESIAVSLSRFDFHLCEFLSSSTDILSEYNHYLTAYANQNNWSTLTYTPINNLTPEQVWKCWASGILEFIGDEAYYNTAYLAIHKQSWYVENAVWLSLLKSLLPMIEEYRIRLIECKKIILPFKHQNEFGVVKSNKYDFEIGDILMMLNTNQIQFKYIPTYEKAKIKQFIILCKTIRDDLAHLKIPKTYDIVSFKNSISTIQNIIAN